MRHRKVVQMLLNSPGAVQPGDASHSAGASQRERKRRMAEVEREGRNIDGGVSRVIVAANAWIDS